MSRLGTNVLVDVIEKVEVGRDRYNNIVYNDVVTHQNVPAALAENGPSENDQLPGQNVRSEDGVTLYIRPAIGIPYNAFVKIQGDKTYGQKKTSAVWRPLGGMRSMSIETVYLETNRGS